MLTFPLVHQHPGVESKISQKSDSLSEEHPDAAANGKKQYESSGRQASRKAGFHDGQVKGCK